MTPSMRIALLVLCTTVYLLCSPGRILFSDDEIVFQTTQSLYERGSLAIDGIPKRSGEPKGRPDGTFGWAPGTDGRRYGFFGHALSVVALPMYGLGKRAAAVAPEAWRHAIRSDTFFLHRRSARADWTRMFVSFTNCVVGAVGAWVLAQWLVALGYGARVAVGVALAYAFGTSAWAYAGTFLSEPLSALMLLTAAWGVTRFLADRDVRRGAARAWLLLAATLVGASVHAHVLNVLAIPAYLLWLALALRRGGDWRQHRRTILLALVLGSAGLIALAVSNQSRFGSPWETGRYDHYSHFVAPAEGLVAMLLAPGRSIFLYSPALLVALPGVRAMVGRHRDLSIFVVVLVALRWGFVAARSDWWGGWAIGPRYLVPLIPFMLLPLAEVLLRATTRARRLGLGAALLACVAVSLHLAIHNIFEHMAHLARDRTTPEYLALSHWSPGASPIVGFWSLPVDTLAHGARQLSQHGHDGLLIAFGGVAVTAVAAGVVLARALLVRPRLAGDRD